MVGETGNLLDYRAQLEVFASAFGLLGVIHEDFLLPPILPTEKLWVAPEAVVETDGTLRRLDPETEGTEVLFDLLEKRGRLQCGPSAARRREAQARGSSVPRGPALRGHTGTQASHGTVA
jgi:hypothetical protein